MLRSDAADEGNVVSCQIIQWGTGNVGTHALRTIVERPDLELVGLRVYNLDNLTIPLHGGGHVLRATKRA